MKICELDRLLLARVQQGPNRLYVLDVDIVKPVCLAARGKENTWCWHARLSHINMVALRRMALEEMVRGLPAIEEVDKLCESCIAGKQRRTSFPNRALRRAECSLELVHGDLGGPVALAMPSGNTYFLLLVDDRSRYI